MAEQCSTDRQPMASRPNKLSAPLSTKLKNRTLAQTARMRHPAPLVLTPSFAATLVSWRLLHEYENQNPTLPEIATMGLPATRRRCYRFPISRPSGSTTLVRRKKLDPSF